MNWLLIVVALLFIYCVYRGYRKGLLRMVYAMVSWIIMLAIVSVGTPYINDYLMNHTALHTTLTEQLEERLQESIKEAGENQLNSAVHSETGQLEAMGVKLPENLVKNVVGYSTDAADNLLQQGGVYSGVAQNLSALAVKGISTLLAWVAAAIIVSVLSHILGIVARIPILRGVNKYLGMAAGAIYALLLVWTLFCITALGAGSGIGLMLNAMIVKSRVLTWIYDNNLVLMILYNFL